MGKRAWAAFGIGATLSIVGLAVCVHFYGSGHRGRPPFQVRGRVVDQDGRGVPDAKVECKTSGNVLAADRSKDSYQVEPVACTTDATGNFTVAFWLDHLEFISVKKDGYVGELADESIRRGWGNGFLTRGLATVVAYDVRRPATDLIVQAAPLDYDLPAGAIRYLDLTSGNTVESSAEADLELRTRASLEPSSLRPAPARIGIEVRSVRGGLRLSTADAPYAPVGDYIEGFRYDWGKVLATNLTPVRVGFFVESRNGQHVGRVDLTLMPPNEKTGDSRVEAVFRINKAGGRYLGVRPYPLAPDGYASPSCVLTEGVWWAHPGGVEPIVSAAQAAVTLSKGPPRNPAAWSLAYSRTTDPATFKTLTAQALSSKDEQLARALAENPMLPGDAALALTQHDDARARELAVAHPALDEQAVRKFATDTNAAVRLAVAGRRNCPIDVAEQLSKDPVADVRAAIAKNPATPSQILISMESDPDQSVRLRVALNPNLPDAQVDQMLAREPELGASTPIRAWRKQH